MDKEKLARSLTADSVELIPFLPYLLQDLWELGSSSLDMLELMNKHMDLKSPLSILDLACGKGAISVILAKELGCEVKGIDWIDEFIIYAKDKAMTYGVSDLCEFVKGDITKLSLHERGYDLVILGAVGDVLGDPKKTIQILKKTIKKHGYILIDDAYGTQGIHHDYYSKEEWQDVFHQTKVTLIEDKIGDLETIKKLNQLQQSQIKKRAHELAVQYPPSSHLFENYILTQQAECEELEHRIKGVTMLLRKNDS